MTDEAHTAIGETEAEAKGPDKKGLQFPGTLTVLVIVTFLVWLAAFIIPSGTYQHDESGVPAPGSFTRIDSPQDFGDRVGDFFLAPVNGLYGLQDPETGVVRPFGVGSLFGAVGVFAFVLAIGAFMTMVLATGALDTAIGKLAYRVRARPWLVIVAVMALFSLLGTTMGWAERDWYIGPHKALLFDGSGNAGPTAWWDGRIVGGWVQRESGEVDLQLLEDIGADGRRALEAEAERLTDWFGGKRALPRFPSPLNRSRS